MKKLNVFILALVLVFAVGTIVSAQTFWEDGNWVIKGGIDFEGEIDYDDLGEQDVDSALSLSGEYVVPYKDNVDLGFGLTYQFEREDDLDVDFNFVPVYGLMKIQSKLDSKYAPYFLAHLGYNFLDTDADDDDGGIYYGLGAGIELEEDVNAELLYSVNNGEINDEDVEYSKLRLGLSCKF